MPFSAAVADEPYAYLTTTGRRTGLPREIEIWFALSDDGATAWVMSGAPARAGWVANLRARPHALLRIAGEERPARAELLEPGSPEDALARARLVAKYATPEQPLERWGRDALPVALRG